MLGKEQDRLVAKISKLLGEWHGFLNRNSPLFGAEIADLSGKGDALAGEARSLDVGGLAHHLEALTRILTSPSPDRAAVNDCLTTLGQICSQVTQPPPPPSQEIQAADVRKPQILSVVEAPAARPSASGGLSPDSMMAMPPIIKEHGPEPAPKGQKPTSSELPPAIQRPELNRAPSADSLLATPELINALSGPAPAIVVEASQERNAPREPPGASVLVRPPKLNMGTMFKLRAFDRPKKPVAVEVPKTAASQAGLLNFQKNQGEERPDSLGVDLSNRLDSLRSGSSSNYASAPPRQAQPADSANSRLGSDLKELPKSQIPPVDQGQLPWWWAAGSLSVVAAVVLGLVLLPSGGCESSHPKPENGTASPNIATELPRSKLLNRKEKLRLLLSQVHTGGGTESPELADLIDEESALLREAMENRCSDSEENCGLAVPSVAGTLKPAGGDHTIRDLFNGRQFIANDKTYKTSHRVPSWLAGLVIPKIGAEPHPKVRRWLEHFTENGVGRERFQTILFRCGEFQDRIEQILTRYSLPISLLALVITESGCIADIESPAGARGLWQFMPATARAYHLRVKDGVVDERINPTKATEAAIHFLSDLYKKTGSWEFALASYNMGPFGLAARLRKAGGKATFWQLADARLIPEETANYVPRIQAYALILANLERFRFAIAQRRAPIAVGDLEAPPGTRLGQVARAAETSVALLKKLNPDLVGRIVPKLPGSPFILQVPKHSIFRARKTLARLLDTGDEADRCVPSDFNWGGSQRFTAKMAAECRGD